MKKKICKSKEVIKDIDVAAYRKCQPDDFRCVGTTPELCIPKEKKCDGYLDSGMVGMSKDAKII